jgi:hypothetical protein
LVLISSSIDRDIKEKRRWAALDSLVRVIVFLVTILVALNAGAASLAADSQPNSPQRAVLTVANAQPLTVLGRGFKTRERIRVSADARRKVVAATARGSFIVRFLELDPCNTVTVTAVGAKGSRASVRLRPSWRVHCAAP